MDHVLIVTPDGPERATMLAELTSAQFDVSSAEDLTSGLARMDLAAPDLLITVVHEHDFNGLPLVEAGGTRNPRMAAVVLHDSPVIAHDCAEMSSPCAVVRHVSHADGLKNLAKLAGEALALRERRRWSRMLLAAPMSVALLPGRARLLNVSYGGVQLELTSPLEGLLPSLFKIELPTVGSLSALRVWSHPSPSTGIISCGAEVSPAGVKRTVRWRRLVDTLRKAGQTVLL